MIKNPEVALLGSTSYSFNSFLGLTDILEVDEDSTIAEDIIEFAGRACYQSFHKPNPATRKNSDYIQHIIDQGHHSVLEHASATFYITGVSRAFTHEPIRHRHLSVSQMSQRFVDESEASIVVPPALRGTVAEHGLQNEMDSLQFTYSDLVETLTEKGHSRKQAREAARAVLPNMTETRIVVTGNFRAFRDMLWKRLDPAADVEIREVSHLLLEELHRLAPSVFQDLVDEFQPE